MKKFKKEKEKFTDMIVKIYNTAIPKSIPLKVKIILGILAIVLSVLLTLFKQLLR